MARHALDIRTVSDLPIILDDACDWSDPMHTRRTIRMAEAAGFSTIEIEDQILPKRAHHHVGTEHLIPLDLMVANVEEAVTARRGDDPLIIARTNAARQPNGRDDALRRDEAMRKAGADLLIVLPGKPEETKTIGKAFPAAVLILLAVTLSSSCPGLTRASAAVHTT